jgi:hypothetical protein
MGAGDRPWLLRGAVIGLALVVGVVSWLATRDDDGEPVAAEPVAESRVIGESELQGIAAASGHPVYWAGSIAGTTLEATESEDGSIQVRYVEEGAESAEALTIGSYPLPDPTAALDSFSEQEGSEIHRSDSGREVVINEQNPTSAYFVSPDNTVQVEVYDPSPERALSLALSERVRPVG